MAVRDLSLFSSFAGHCTAGWMTPADRSTSVIRSAAHSANRNPACAPIRIAGRTPGGNAS